MRLVLLLAFLLSGCGRSFYAVPSDAADFASIGLRPPESAEEIAATLARKPAAHLPATLATVRLQGRGNSYVVNLRGPEDQDMQQLASMRGIASVVPMSQIVCPGQVSRVESLRSAAASVRADLVLVYTFDTVTSQDTTIPVLGVLTLGIFPNEIARATSTGSAALVDTRTGYIYGLSEATSRQYRITNAWNVWTARDKTAEDARCRACTDLAAQVERLWNGVLARCEPDYRSEPSDGIRNN